MTASRLAVIVLVGAGVTGVVVLLSTPSKTIEHTNFIRDKAKSSGLPPSMNSPSAEDAGKLDSAVDVLSAPIRNEIGPPTLAMPERLLEGPQMKRLERQFQAASLDFEWARSMESRIYSALSETKLLIFDLRAQCRTRICRIEVGVGPLLDGNGSSLYNENSPYFMALSKAIRPIVEAENERVDGVSLNKISGVHTDADSGLSLLYVYYQEPGSMPSYTEPLYDSPSGEPARVSVRRTTVTDLEDLGVVTVDRDERVGRQ